MNRLIMIRPEFVRRARCAKRCFALPVAASLLAMWLVGCGQVDVSVDGGSAVPRAIGFGSSVVSMPAPDTRGAAVSKADQSALLSMGVYAFHTGAQYFASTTLDDTPQMNNQLVTRSLIGGVFSSWTYSPSQYWLEGKTSFLGYAPHTTEAPGGSISLAMPATPAMGTAGAPVITYSVPAVPARQPDLLIATPATDLVRREDEVTLTMQHALTLIGFSASVAASDIADGIKIRQITVKGVYSKGVSTLITPVQWSTLADTCSYQLSIADGQLADKALTTTPVCINTSNNFLLLMPQPFAASGAAHTVIEVIYSDLTGKDVLIETFPICHSRQAWLPGEAINYQLQIDGKVVSITASIVAWTEKMFYGGNHSGGHVEWE